MCGVLFGEKYSSWFSVTHILVVSWFAYSSGTAHARQSIKVPHTTQSINTFQAPHIRQWIKSLQVYSTKSGSYESEIVHSLIFSLSWTLISDLSIFHSTNKILVLNIRMFMYFNRRMLSTSTYMWLVCNGKNRRIQYATSVWKITWIVGLKNKNKMRM